MSGLREAIDEAMRAQGLTDDPATYDSDIHSWRCSHPDIYGPCSCFAEAVGDVEAAVLAWVAERLGDRALRDRAVTAAYQHADDNGMADHEEAVEAALSVVRADLSDKQGEMAHGGHRDDERPSGPGMGGEG